MQKWLIIILSILILFPIADAIQSENTTIDARIDFGGIAFNSTNEDARGYGSYISARNSTSRLGILNYDIQNPDIILISPENNLQDSDGRIDFSYKVLDNSTISSCSLYLVETEDTETQTNILRDVINTITVSGLSIKSNPYNWYINCTDSYGLVGQSEQRKFTVASGIVGGGGGGGVPLVQEVPAAISITIEEIKSIPGNISTSFTSNPLFWLISLILIGFSIPKTPEKRKKIKAYGKSLYLGTAILLFSVYPSLLQYLGRGFDKFSLGAGIINAFNKFLLVISNLEIKLNGIASRLGGFLGSDNSLGMGYLAIIIMIGISILIYKKGYFKKSEFVS